MKKQGEQTERQGKFQNNLKKVGVVSYFEIFIIVIIKAIPYDQT